MARTRWVWHRVAQFVVLGSVWACSGEASDEAAESADTQNPDDSPEEPESPAEDTEQGEDVEDPEGSRLEPLATAIRVLNGSDEMRSRYSPCAGTYTIGIRPAAVESVPRQPTCSKIDCAALPDGEVLMPAAECAVPACQSARVDLPPGGADLDFHWDGTYLALTQRNCYEPTTFEPGTPMLARVCFGKPAAGDFDVQEYTCTDHPFAYGAPMLEVELE